MSSFFSYYWQVLGLVRSYLLMRGHQFTNQNNTIMVEEQRLCTNCGCTLYPEERGYCDNCLEGYSTAEEVDEDLMSEWEVFDWERSMVLYAHCCLNGYSFQRSNCPTLIMYV